MVIYVAGLLHRVVAGLPGFLVESARSARTAFYKLVSPLDAWNRRRRGEGTLPPLWLRRHAGRVADFERPNAAWVSMLQTHGAIDRDDLTYLDVGCGPGALALALRSRLGPRSRYVGFDVHEPSIRWCSHAFGGDRRFEFELAGVASPYGNPAGESALTYRFPLGDAEASAVLARSVFTHLLEPEAAHYLREVRRVLASDGLAFISAFLFEGPGGRDEVPAFPFPNRTSHVRWRVGARPHAGVAYSREGFFDLVRAGNLRVLELRPGFLPGRSPQLTGQDLIVLSPFA